MNTIEAINERRSVRSFTKQSISKEIVKQIIHAATMAASASNAQPWMFLVVRDQQRLNALKAISPGIIGEPTTVVVICVDVGKGKGHDRSSITDFNWMSIGCATQNLLLATHDLGLGACPVASFHKGAASILLNLPDHIQPVLLIALGYTEKFPSAPKKRNLSEICFSEEWGIYYE